MTSARPGTTVLTLLVVFRLFHIATPGEFCLLEHFNATCRQPDELVVIQQARYGRMSIGRCITGSYGQLGCSVDVRRLLDIKCSGRRSCRVSVPDSDLLATRPCPGDFTSYLDATYSCQKVAFSDRTTCQRNRALRIQAGIEGYPAVGYLASVTTEDFGFGSSECPWVIETQPGQRINITLYNYAAATNVAVHHGSVPLSEASHRTAAAAAGDLGGPTGHVDYAAHQHPHPSGHRRLLPPPQVCVEVTVISDSSERRVVSLCGSGTTAGSAEPGAGGGMSTSGIAGAVAVETVVALSRTNEIRIEVMNRHMLRSIGAFVLQYRVFGCRTLPAVGEYWYRRDGDTLQVGCNSTSDTWFLVCKDTQWFGDIGNCTTSTSLAGYADWKIESFFSSDDTFSIGILLVVCIGVAMGIIVGGILLCVVTVLTKRSRQTSTIFGVLSAAKRPLVSLPPDPTSLPLRSPGVAGIGGGGFYSTGGATLLTSGDYGWRHMTGSTHGLTTGGGGDVFDCDLLSTAGKGINAAGGVGSIESLSRHGGSGVNWVQQHQTVIDCSTAPLHQHHHHHHLIDDAASADSSNGASSAKGCCQSVEGDRNETTLGSTSAAGADVEMNYGLRWAAYRSGSIGSCRAVELPPPRSTGDNDGECTVDSVERHHQTATRSPMSSFGMRWNGARTHFYEIPQHCHS